MKQEAGESPNGRNDRAIRVAAAWYTERLPGHKVGGRARWRRWVGRTECVGGHGQCPGHGTQRYPSCPPPLATHPPCQVILLTDDADNRRKAGLLGVEALGSAAYARQRAAEQPELQDLVATAVEARKEAEAAEGGAGGAAAGALCRLWGQGRGGS